MLESVGKALARVREDHPVDPSYFFFAGYLTPNGELHLGHLGGPYLRSDAAARCLEMYGAKVACATGSDAFESSVTYAAAANSAPQTAGSIATHFTDRAALALRGMRIRQDDFVNPCQDPVRSEAGAACHELASALDAVGRLTVREEQLFLGTPPAPPAATGAFASGDCPFCEEPQSGNVCEQCGRWMDPERMTSAWSADPASGAPRRGSIASVFVRTAPGLSTEAMRNVLEPEFAYLVRDYPSTFGDLLRISYPSWWGIPWNVALTPAAHPDSVFSSYVMGKYGSTRVLGARHRDRTGVDPFASGSGVTTVAVGGLDSAFGWISLQALVDPTIDFASFDHIVVNRFMLLRGDKFSTSRKHVIRVNDALEAGLVPDVLRLILARVSPSHDESDFVPEKAAAQSSDDCALLLSALRRSEGSGSEPEVAPQYLEAAVACLRQQRAAFDLPAVDLPGAADGLLNWASLMHEGGVDRSPRFARQVLALLALPLMPDWGRAVWATVTTDPLPGLSSDTEAGGHPVDPHDLPPVSAAELDALAERGRTS
ncbi:class I tRNA ligase family protein [Streptomyces sp. NPDC059340]|uniref:class I tRNA ligase family protein n=1 Tax=Streptomyces sp. NPDC059340 TaxID=3346806 RepID=UPI0036CFBE7C